MNELTDKIFNEFKEFSDGIRILYLIDRSNSNTNRTSSRWVKKIITCNQREYKEAISNLLQLRVPGERIYASVNQRSFRKATRIFKQMQLDNEYMSDAQNFDFHRNICNNWISALTKQGSNTESNFLLDLDSDQDKELTTYLMTLAYNDRSMINHRIIKKYKTKKGYHFVTTPFNSSLFKFDNCEIKKDALLLLYYE